MHVLFSDRSKIEYAFVVAIHVVALRGDAVSQTFVASFDVGNVNLVQGGAPLPSFLCLVTGKADLPLVLHSTHQKLFFV